MPIHIVNTKQYKIISAEIVLDCYERATEYIIYSTSHSNGMGHTLKKHHLNPEFFLWMMSPTRNLLPYALHHMI